MKSAVIAPVISCVIFLLIFFTFTSVVQPAPNNLKDGNNESKSVFGPVFDEIVVESSLTVRRKPPGREGRNLNTTEPVSRIVKAKREIPGAAQKPKISAKFLGPKPHQIPKTFGASAANSQSQSFSSFGPLGNFGASATGAQTQGFSVGPNGLLGSAAAFSGTQRYNFNDKTVEVVYGFSGAKQGADGTPTITIEDSQRRRRPLNG